ncbi:MAG: YihY family inner membrane protein [Planctomycetes bacterium]|nr:YihY family inner membrane protein [Planctomycetota bacterium]
MLTKLLTTPTAQLGKASRFAVFQIKLWSHCAKLLRKNRAGQQAAALSYHTIFGIVPLAIVMLLIFQLLPAYEHVGEKVKTFVYDQLNLTKIEYAPDEEKPEEKVNITSNIDRIVGKFFTGTNTGAITLFSVLFVIWAALALLSTIERAFNRIWHVMQGRSFIQRIINYWALLTLGPLLLGAGIFVTTKFSMLDKLQQTLLSTMTPQLFSYIIATVAFFLLYFVLPNTKVNAKSAIWGAAVAALVWSLAKAGFGYYIIEAKPYGTVYGVMALIPITVLWIYITWIIVLFGLQLTFTTQHLTSLDAAEIAAAQRNEDYFIANDITVINIAREVAAAFERNNAPVEIEVVSSKLNIPPQFTEKILHHLVANGILIKSSDPKIGFMPAQDPENIKLSDIDKAVAAAGFAQQSIDQPEAIKKIAQEKQNTLAQYNLKQMINPQQQQE